MHNYAFGTHAEDRTEAVADGSDRDTDLGLLSSETDIAQT